MNEVTKIKEGYYSVEDADGNPYILITNAIDSVVSNSYPRSEVDRWEAQIILDSVIGEGTSEIEAVTNALEEWRNGDGESESEEKISS